MTEVWKTTGFGQLQTFFIRHPGEGRDLAVALFR